MRPTDTRLRGVSSAKVRPPPSAARKGWTLLPRAPQGTVLHPLESTGEGPTCSDPTGEGPTCLDRTGAGPPPSGPLEDGPTSSDPAGGGSPSDPWGQSCPLDHTGAGHTSSGPTGTVLALGPHGEGATSSDTAGDGPSASDPLGDCPPPLWCGQEGFDMVCAEHQGRECLVPREERRLLSAAAQGGVASVPTVGVLRPRKGLAGEE